MNLSLIHISEKIPSELSYNKLCLNVQTHECLLDGEPVSLTPTEFSILHVLLSSAGNVVSIEELFHAVWKDEYYSKNSSTITVHIRHLREKLNDTSDTPQYIKTIWGVGYKIFALSRMDSNNIHSKLLKCSNCLLYTSRCV